MVNYSYMRVTLATYSFKTITKMLYEHIIDMLTIKYKIEEVLSNE